MGRSQELLAPAVTDERIGEQGFAAAKSLGDVEGTGSLRVALRGGIAPAEAAADPRPPRHALVERVAADEIYEPVVAAQPGAADLRFVVAQTAFDAGDVVADGSRRVETGIGDQRPDRGVVAGRFDVLLIPRAGKLLGVVQLRVVAGGVQHEAQIPGGIECRLDLVALGEVRLDVGPKAVARIIRKAFWRRRGGCRSCSTPCPRGGRST